MISENMELDRGGETPQFYSEALFYFNNTNKNVHAI